MVRLVKREAAGISLISNRDRSEPLPGSANVEAHSCRLGARWAWRRCGTSVSPDLGGGISISITSFPYTSVHLPAPQHTEASWPGQTKWSCKQGSASRAFCCLSAFVLGQCCSTDFFFGGGGVEWNFSFRLPAVAAAQLQPGSAARLHLPFQFQGSPSSELVLGQQKGLDILPRLQLSRLGFGSPSRPGKSNCGLPPLRCLAADPGVQIYPGLTNLATAQTLGPTATFGTPAPLRSSVMPPPRVGTSLPRPGRAWEGRAPCRGHCRG